MLLRTMEASYRITVRGRLTDRLGDAFAGMALDAQRGVTILVGELRDQAELYGILDRLRDLGIELLRVERAE
jgi:hypothetical protein